MSDSSEATYLGDARWLVRCNSTGSGSIRDGAVRALHAVVCSGVLDDAEEVEFALATLGGGPHAKHWLETLAKRPPRALKRISFGGLLTPLDVETLRASWSRFPFLEQGPETSWRAATRPRIEVFALGPHFLNFRVGQRFELAADGAGPWLALRPPGPGMTEFDSLALRANVSSDNLVEVQFSPLEPADEVRINGESVELQTLWMHRGAAKLKRATVSWLAVDGDEFEVLGLGVRYREDIATDRVAFSRRAPLVAMMGSGSTTVELTLPESPPRELDDDDD